MGSGQVGGSVTAVTRAAHRGTDCSALDTGCVSANDKNATSVKAESNWKPMGPWPKMKSDTTAWDYITSNPDLSSIAGVLKQLGLDAKLKGPFTGTLLLPTNDVSIAEWESLHNDLLNICLSASVTTLYLGTVVFAIFLVSELLWETGAAAVPPYTDLLGDAVT